MSRHWISAAVCTMILAGQAFGHAKLRSTMPAADAELRIAPKTLTLTFNEEARLAFLTLSIDGKEIPVTVDRNAPAAAQVTVPLPALAAGKYLVQWSALSPKDGHVSKGAFSFAIVGHGDP
ncbi:MAG: copper resistance CopC family protein [Gammaproteobacteria bacterium]